MATCNGGLYCFATTSNTAPLLGEVSPEPIKTIGPGRKSELFIVLLYLTATYHK